MFEEIGNRLHSLSPLAGRGFLLFQDL